MEIENRGSRIGKTSIHSEQATKKPDNADGNDGRIEQAIGKLKRFKRIAMRCEKTAESFAGLVAFACALILVQDLVHNTSMAAFVTKNYDPSRMVALEPIERFGEPEEIAAAVVWLCSPAASFMVGHAMAVDGGG